MYAAAALIVVTVPARAAEPYAPHVQIPIENDWRWRTYVEPVKGKELRCLEVTEGAGGEAHVVWLGVANGALKYDGLDWVLYDASSGMLAPPVNELCAAGPDSVFAGTEAGISCYSPSRDTWRAVFPTDGTHLFPVLDMDIDAEGTLWAASAWGLLSLSATDTTLHTSSEIASSIGGMFPGLHVETVPPEVLPRRLWVKPVKGNGSLGVWTAYVGFMSMPRGSDQKSLSESWPKVDLLTAQGSPQAI